MLDMDVQLMLTVGAIAAGSFGFEPQPRAARFEWENFRRHRSMI